MKVCYFIQTHKNPDQIYRLVRTIKHSSPNSQILIGHDFTNSDLDITPLQDLSEVNLLRSDVPRLRGDFSLIEPYLNAINWLCEHNSDFDWLIYISGQDYLTQSAAEIDDFLSTTEYDGFIRYWDVFSKESPWGKAKGFKRYLCQYYRVSGKWSNWFFNRRDRIEKYTPIEFFSTYGRCMGLPALFPPFNKNFICYGGYQWHTLSRKCVLFLKDYIQKNPKLVKYYKKTIVPDESFVQTILVNSQLFNFCNDDKRYFDTFNRPGGHSRVLTTEDYSKITSGGYHFARKFEPEQDAKILDMLDDKVLQA